MKTLAVIAFGLALCAVAPVSHAGEAIPDASASEELQPIDFEFDDELRNALLETDSGTAPQPFRLIGAGRLRLQLPHVGAPSNIGAPQLVLGAYVGVEVPLAEHTATISVGDGFLVGEGRTVNPANLLYEAKLAFRFKALGAPATLTVGRMRAQIADGRILGFRAFTPSIGLRHDGAQLTLDYSSFSVRARGLYLGPYDASGLTRTSYMASTELMSDTTFSVFGSNVDASGTTYALYHKDGSVVDAGFAPVNAVTAGFRADAQWNDVELDGGADGQIQTFDTNPLEPAGAAFHVEGRIRYAPKLAFLDVDWTPYVGLGAEATYGRNVAHRVFRTPSGAIHAYLGNLDLFLLDNVAAANLFLGVENRDGFRTEVSVLGYALADPPGLLLSTDQSMILPSVSTPHGYEVMAVEADINGTIPLHENIFIQAEYGVGMFSGRLSARPLTQRLLLSLQFTL